MHLRLFGSHGFSITIVLVSHILSVCLLNSFKLIWQWIFGFVFANRFANQHIFFFLFWRLVNNAHQYLTVDNELDGWQTCKNHSITLHTIWICVPHYRCHLTKTNGSFASWSIDHVVCAEKKQQPEIKTKFSFRFCCWLFSSNPYN